MKPKSEKPKIHVLDTSVAMHDAESPENFKDNDVHFHVVSIEEMERNKTAPGTKGASARAALRKILTFSDVGSLQEGVATRGKGKFFISYTSDADFTELPVGLEITNDNRIILLAKKLQQAHPDRKVVLVSKEHSMRIKANTCGICAEDYQHDKRIASLEELYSGFQNIVLKNDKLGIFAELQQEKQIDEDFIRDAAEKELNLYPNHCCLIRDMSGQDALVIYKKKDGKFVLVKTHMRKSKDEVLPRNMYQWFAYAHLMDPTVRILTLNGVAGAGKTLLSVLAGVEQLVERYDQILVFRPNVEVGPELGFMPGDMNDKFKFWKRPIFSQLRRIFANASKDDKKKTGKKTDPLFDVTKEYLGDGFLEILPIAHIQGDTFHRIFALVDEAENTTPREAQALITRLGEGSKIVLVGDPSQIFRPRVDSIANGLVDTITLLTGAEYYAHLYMPISEREAVVQDIVDRISNRGGASQ